MADTTPLPIKTNYLQELMHLLEKHFDSESDHQIATDIWGLRGQMEKDYNLPEKKSD